MSNRVVSGPVRPVRKSFDDLFRDSDQLWFTNEKGLKNWIKDNSEIIPLLTEREKKLRESGRKGLSLI